MTEQNRRTSPLESTLRAYKNSLPVMTVATFMAWSKLTNCDVTTVLPPFDDSNYIRELGGIEKFLSRKIPGTNKVDYYE